MFLINTINMEYWGRYHKNKNPWTNNFEIPAFYIPEYIAPSAAMKSTSIKKLVCEDGSVG